MAQEWLDAWNAHDPQKVVAHFADDVVVRSPVAGQLVRDQTAELRGKDSVLSYYRDGLSRVVRPSILACRSLHGVEDVTIVVRGTRTDQRSTERDEAPDPLGRRRTSQRAADDQVAGRARRTGATCRRPAHPAVVEPRWHDVPDTSAAPAVSCDTDVDHRRCGLGDSGARTRRGPGSRRRALGSAASVVIDATGVRHVGPTCGSEPAQCGPLASQSTESAAQSSGAVRDHRAHLFNALVRSGGAERANRSPDRFHMPSRSVGTPSASPRTPLGAPTTSCVSDSHTSSPLPVRTSSLDHGIAADCN